MIIPSRFVPYEMWNLWHGEDAAYFFQPTTDPCTMAPLACPACVAWCTMGQLAPDPGCPGGEPPDDPHDGTWSLPMQCGVVALAAPDGDWLCQDHLQMLWLCQACGGWLPYGRHDGHGDRCAPCQAAFEAGQLCQDCEGRLPEGTVGRCAACLEHFEARGTCQGCGASLPDDGFICDACQDRLLHCCQDCEARLPPGAIGRCAPCKEAFEARQSLWDTPPEDA